VIREVTSVYRVELGCRDLERSVAFYRDLLGFPEAGFPEVPAPSGRCLRAGSVLIQLTQAGPAARDGGWVNDDRQRCVRHFGMKVGDIDAQIERLRAAGVRVLSPPADVLGGVRIAFFLDPDGARLEFIQGTLGYQQVAAPDLAEAEAAADRTAPDGPRFDHVAVTVTDLAGALRFWRNARGYRVIGAIRHHDDRRGFLMTYLQAGPAVLEVFSFDVPTYAGPPAAEPGMRLGFHDVHDREGTSLLYGGAR
jgi:catechol 2,3-dioxygenase-like lactoylglutathione lyase family enzyme